jgi:hypothetical protein
MKTKKVFFRLLLGFGILLPSFAAFSQKQEKEINKEFQVNKGDILSIENKFGDIEVLNWDKPMVSVDVKLSAVANSDDVAKSIIQKMSIEINKSGNTISATSSFDNEEGMNDGNRFAVNYSIYVPKWINLNLSNKFGSINIDKIAGQVNIELKHGDLRINSLERGSEKPYNNIEMGYSNGFIENAGNLDLELSFSKLEADEAENLVLDTKYSGLNANTCNSFTCDSKYDNFRFNELKNIFGNLQYSNLKIGKFSGRAEFESTYSGVKIDEVLPSFESIKIENSRGGYKLGINPETSFDLDATSVRGDVAIEGYEITDKRTDGTTKFIKASGGTEGTGKTITISTEEGSVKLTKN